MLSEHKISLNVISENSAIALIQGFLNKGYNVKNVFVDTVGSPEVYQRLLENKFKGKDIKFRVEKKADSLFKIVSAASIVAKVNRDRILAEWTFSEKLDIDRDFGSGYPGDGLTQKWLLRNCDPVMGFPTLVRYSWSTADKIIKEHMVGLEPYSTEIHVSNDYLDDLGLTVSKSFKALISKHDLYKNLDEMLSVSGKFEL
jgi:ribonuclease H2 subunit A